jgi:hypothetical protein
MSYQLEQHPVGILERNHAFIVEARNRWLEANVVANQSLDPIADAARKNPE